MTASFIVLSRFPRDEFAPTLEAMPDGEALTKQLGFFTLLRQHDLLFDLPVEQACRTIVEGFRQVSLHPELREQND